MSDILDKLAMEVGSWSASGFYKAGMKNGDYELLNDPYMEAAWEDRRKELINEPHDSEAPEGARWKAQDSCGKWFWYATKPRVGESMWMVDGWQGSNNGKIPAGHDWRTTLKEVSKVESSPTETPKDGCAVNSEGCVADCIVLIQELVYILNSCDDELACLALNKKIRDLLDKL